MGNRLPASALKYKAWWSNRDSPNALQAGAWVQAGYEVIEVDLNQQSVTFKKFQAQYKDLLKEGEISWNGDAIKALRRHKGLNQEDFAKELGVRRETVSEWENNKYEPDRSRKKFLDLIAEQSRFRDTT